MDALTRLRLLTALLVSWGGMARADIMDDIDVRREGQHAVIQIHMTTPVSLIRSTVSRTNDLTQAYYQVKRSEGQVPYVEGERRVIESEGLPIITISDEPVRSDLLQDSNRRLVITLSQGGKFKVRAGKGDRSIELVLEGMGHAVKSAATVKPAPPPSLRYAIALARSAAPKVEIDVPIPQSMQAYQVFTTRREVDGHWFYEMDLGYFDSLAEAEAALRQLSRFPKAVIVKITGEQTGETPPPALAQAPANAPAAVPASQATELLVAGRQAYEQQRFDDAVAILSQAVESPVPAVAAEAQELLGMTRLAQGEVSKAQAEFESYLKQYPKGVGADRVRAALAGLPREVEQPPVAVQEAPKKPDGKPTVTASIAQYFYGGQSTMESQAVRDADGSLLSPDQINQRSLAPISSIDQEMLSTNMDMTWRSRDTERDIKLVVRDQYDYNLIDQNRLRGKSRSRNRLTAAYMDYQSLTSGFRGRFGRQSAMWGGEGRYDGANVSYVFRPKWKASFSAGMPTDALAQSNRQFAGVSLDADALTPNIGASVFALQRMIDGEVDRRTVGADLRFFNQNSSVMGSTDFDVLFKKLNVASLQGMYLGEGNTTVNMLLERRSLAQASLGQTLFFQFSELSLAGLLPQTINDLKQHGYSVSQLRELVRSNTSYSTHGMVSVTTPITTQWQWGVDLHINRIGAIAPNPVLPDGQPDSGMQRTVGLQAIGTNLYSGRDTSVFAGSVMNSGLVKFRQISYNNMTALGESWQIEPAMRWQHSVAKEVISGLNITTTAWGPGLKLSYKPRPAMTLESNLNVDYTSTEGVTNNDRSTRFTYFLGYRYFY